MKIIYLFSALMGLTLTACSQDIPASKIPSLVLNTVLTKFPGASNIEWEKKKNYYEAEFKIDSVEHQLDIDADGHLLQQKKELHKSEIPVEIKQTVQSNYPEYKIDDADLIDKNGKLVYELELEARGKKDKKIYCTADGKLITNN